MTALPLPHSDRRLHPADAVPAARAPHHVPPEPDAGQRRGPLQLQGGGRQGPEVPAHVRPSPPLPGAARLRPAVLGLGLGRVLGPPRRSRLPGRRCPLAHGLEAGSPAECGQGHLPPGPLLGLHTAAFCCVFTLLHLSVS